MTPQEKATLLALGVLLVLAVVAGVVTLMVY